MSMKKDVAFLFLTQGKRTVIDRTDLERVLDYRWWVETIDTAASYRQAFKKRRCLVPTDGFFEWKTPGGKIPYAIGMKDDSPFVFAGLWEGWKDPATDEWLRTCTIITGEPNEFMRQIHTRMPVILQEEQHDAWLSGVAGKEVWFHFRQTE
jgi:putative SOS response-associated peptidase YedK